MSFDNEKDNIYLTIIYKPSKDNDNKVRIFGESFVYNNKDKCKIIFQDKQYEIKNFFEEIDSKYNNKDEIRFILNLNNNINDLSCMFDECNTLSSISEITETSLLGNSNFVDMASSIPKSDSLFYSSEESKINDSCETEKSNEINPILIPSTISSIPKNINSKSTDIDESINKDKKFSTISSLKLKNIYKMFCGCNSLISLPDISKWVFQILNMANSQGGNTVY